MRQLIFLVECHEDLSQPSEHQTLLPDIDTVWNGKILNLQVCVACYGRSWEVSAQSVVFFLCHLGQMFICPESCKLAFPVENVSEEFWLHLMLTRVHVP